MPASPTNQSRRDKLRPVVERIHELTRNFACERDLEIGDERDMWDDAGCRYIETTLRDEMPRLAVEDATLNRPKNRFTVTIDGDPVTVPARNFSDSGPLADAAARLAHERATRYANLLRDIMDAELPAQKPVRWLIGEMDPLDCSTDFVSDIVDGVTAAVFGIGTDTGSLGTIDVRSRVLVSAQRYRYGFLVRRWVHVESYYEYGKMGVDTERYEIEGFRLPQGTC